MHYTNVLLGRAHIAGVLEGDPRVACFKQHGQHLAPHIGSLHRAVGTDLTIGSFGLVSHVSFLKISAKFIVQVWYVVGREQSPLALFHDAAHK